MTGTTGGTRAVGYTRISKDEEGASMGVERQADAIRRLADRLGYELVEMLVDNDISASKGLRRPGYQRLLAMGPSIDVVLAYDYTRLTRSESEGVELTKWAERHGVAFMYTSATAPDLSTAHGRMAMRTDRNNAVYESDRLGERVRDALAQRRNKGVRHLGGRRLFGYAVVIDHEDKGYRTAVVVPEEAVVVQRMVAMAMDGTSANAIAKWLNAEGIPNSVGAPWSGSGVAKVINNDTYAGLLTHHGEVLGQGTHDAIVSLADLAAAQAALARWAQPDKRHGKATLWSGLIRCGSCGSVLIRTASAKDRGGLPSWGCKASGCPARVYVRAEVETYLTSEVLQRLAVHVRRRTDDAPVRRSADDVRDDAARLFDMRALLSAEAYEARRVALADELRAAEAVGAAPTSAQKLVDNHEDLADVWHELGDGVRRELIEMVLDHALIAKASRRGFWNMAVAAERTTIVWRE